MTKDMKIAVFENDLEVVEYLFNLYYQSNDDSAEQDYAVTALEAEGVTL